MSFFPVLKLAYLFSKFLHSFIVIVITNIRKIGFNDYPLIGHLGCI